MFYDRNRAATENEIIHRKIFGYCEESRTLDILLGSRAFIRDSIILCSL